MEKMLTSFIVIAASLCFTVISVSAWFKYFCFEFWYTKLRLKVLIVRKRQIFTSNLWWRHLSCFAFTQSEIFLVSSSHVTLVQFIFCFN